MPFFLDEQVGQTLLLFGVEALVGRRQCLDLRLEVGRQSLLFLNVFCRQTLLFRLMSFEELLLFRGQSLHHAVLPLDLLQ